MAGSTLGWWLWRGGHRRGEAKERLPSGLHRHWEIIFFLGFCCWRAALSHHSLLVPGTCGTPHAAVSRDHARHENNIHGGETRGAQQGRRGTKGAGRGWRQGWVVPRVVAASPAVALPPWGWGVMVRAAWIQPGWGCALPAPAATVAPGPKSHRLKMLHPPGKGWGLVGETLPMIEPTGPGEHPEHLPEGSAPTCAMKPLWDEPARGNSGPHDALPLLPFPWLWQ